MKRLLVLGLILCAATVQSGGLTPVNIRIAGTAGISYTTTVLASDTGMFADTFYSDSFDLAGLNNFQMAYVLDTIRYPAGANDSGLWIIRMIARNNQHTIEKLIRTDTLGGNNIRRDTTWLIFDVDTLKFQRVYWQSIFKDSVISQGTTGQYLRGFIQITTNDCP